MVKILIIAAFSLDIDTRIYYNIISYNRARLCVGHAAGGSCATGRRESCQAGNRAALIGLHCAPQIAYPPYDHNKERSVCFYKSCESGENMYQALYRKWRPRTFDDVVGQQNITATLSNEVESGSVSHAYLFTGSRGTGKTTCAKILAKAVNCLNPQQGNPCNACEICLGVDSGAIMDVVELDAASNNGVDDIREMIDETVFTPVKAKYRVYIIDEAHMLTAAACNAFLKTLEEPPEHVIFILATTDPQKLLQTIRSRCQRFDFRRIGSQDIAERLQVIARQEGFSLDEDAAMLIARIADGALRDAVSLLDLCAVTDKHITAQAVSAAAGLADKEFLFVLTDCIKTRDTAKALELVNELHRSYADMTNLCAEFINHMRNLMIIKSVKTPESLITCTSADFERLENQAGNFTLDEILHTMFLLEETAYNLSKGYNKRTEFELAVIRLCTPGTGNGDDSVSKRLSALEAMAFPANKSFSPPATVTPTEAKPEPVPLTYKQPAQNIPPAALPGNSTPVSANPTPQETPQSVSETSRQHEDAHTADNNIEENTPQVACTPGSGQIPFDLWSDVLCLINKKLPSLWAFIRSACVFVEEDTLIFCAEKIEPIESFINISNNLDILKLCIFEVSNIHYKIKCKKLDSFLNASPADNSKSNNFFDTMKKIKFDS